MLDVMLCIDALYSCSDVLRRHIEGIFASLYYMHQPLHILSASFGKRLTESAVLFKETLTFGRHQSRLMACRYQTCQRLQRSFRFPYCCWLTAIYWHFFVWVVFLVKRTTKTQKYAERSRRMCGPLHSSQMVRILEIWDLLKNHVTCSSKLFVSLPVRLQIELFMLKITLLFKSTWLKSTNQQDVLQATRRLMLFVVH